MKNFFKYILYFGVLCFSLFFSTSKILAATCNKALVSGDTTSGVTCTYHTNSPDYCTASCASGWDSSCDSDEYISSTSEVRCYITDSNCNNIARCYDCTELSCGSKTHLGDCPTWLGFEETNCTVTYPGGNPYTCCDCNQSTDCVYNSDCNDGNDCTSDYCNTSTGDCSYTTITDGDCADEEPSGDYSESCYCGTDNSYLGTAQCDYYYNSDDYNWHQWFYYNGTNPDAIKPSNCSCDTFVWGGYYFCYSYAPYLCNNQCYDTPVCNSCNGSCTCGVDSYGWCIPLSDGISGQCNTYTESNRQPSIPASNVLCYSGTPTTPILSDDKTLWNWSCMGTSGVCGGTNGSDMDCSAMANTPPTFQGLEIRNSMDNMVLAENSGGYRRNHICQITHDNLYGFDGSRSVTIKVLASDVDGYNDIKSITLNWNGKIIPQISSGTGFAIFGWSGDIPNDWNDNIYTYPLIVTITDKQDESITNSSRLFKIWDCGVSVSGTIYDGTDGVICPDTGFSTVAPEDILNLTDLIFTNNNIGTSMTINSPANTYSSGSNKLTWGLNYGFSFNDSCSISSTTLRDKDSLATEWNCNGILYTSDANAYDDNPTLIADFSGTLIQDPWWQADGGGVISNTSIEGQVPVTCIFDTNGCVGEISIDGLVSAPNINNIGNQNWFYGSTSGFPNNNATLANYNTNYSYFYTQYFVKKEIGSTLVGTINISDIGETGIYFVKGDLTIDTDKILANPNDFLMIIVDGNIIVNENVTQVDGILVANNISASGVNATALTFNGSLYAANNVNFSRDYDEINRIKNNTTPAVVVKYNPELIFNMPGDIAKVLTNWQWGN